MTYGRLNRLAIFSIYTALTVDTDFDDINKFGKHN